MKFDFKVFGIRFLIVDIFKFIHCENLACQNDMTYKVNDQNVIDIEEWQGKKCVENFRCFLRENNIGLYVYRDNKVVARAWAFILNRRSKLYRYSYLEDVPIRIGYVEVREEYRNMGLSHVLLNDLLLLCRNIDLQSVYIDISSNNMRMQKLVRKCGFEYCASAFVLQIRKKNILEVRLNRKNGL